MTGESLGLIIHSVHRPTLLSKLLLTLESQVNRDFKIMLVNNGGTPETSRVMRDFQRSSDLAIEFVHKEINAPFDIKRAATFASVVCFIGDDDLLKSSYTAEMRALMREEPDASMYAFATSTISARGIPMGISYSPFRKERLTHSQQIGLQLSDCSLIFETTGFRLERIPRNDIERSDFDYVVDWWLELLTLMTGSCAVSRKRIYQKRIHSRQVSTVADRRAFEGQRLGMMQRFLGTEAFGNFLASTTSSDRVAITNKLLESAAGRGGILSSDILVVQALVGAQSMSHHGMIAEDRDHQIDDGRIMTVEPSDFQEATITPTADLIAALKFTAAEGVRRAYRKVPLRRRH